MLNTVESLLNAMSKIAPMAIPCVSTKNGGWYHFKKPVLVDGSVVFMCVDTYHDSDCTGVQEVRDVLAEFDQHALVKIDVPMIWKDLKTLRHVKRSSGSAIFMV